MSAIAPISDRGYATADVSSGLGPPDPKLRSLRPKPIAWPGVPPIAAMRDESSSSGSTAPRPRTMPWPGYAAATANPMLRSFVRTSAGMPIAAASTCGVTCGFQYASGRPAASRDAVALSSTSIGSMNPAHTTRPLASWTVVPSGIFTEADGPTASIHPSRITTVASLMMTPGRTCTVAPCSASRRTSEGRGPFTGAFWA